MTVSLHYILAIIVPLLLLVGDTYTGDKTVGTPTAATQEETIQLRLLAVGDMNLGRKMGRMLLEGDTLAPFRMVEDTFAKYDVVFGNLECPISEQGGMTEHPQNNMIFTAPPVAAWSLARGGINAVSTANNHALDFGTAALHETRRWLDSTGVVHAGTAADPALLYEPALLGRNGIRIALFACTDFVNDSPAGWNSVVAAADTGRLFPRMRAWRDSVDFLMLSYHAGNEYTDEPSAAVQEFARRAVDAGADLVVGHHPHVPHGVERYRGAWIVHSLGNFVFRQPGRFWTQHGIAFAVTLERRGKTRTMRDARVLPVRSDFQPTFLEPGAAYDRVIARVRALSTRGIEEFALW
ncbi:MAG: hypothetical protein H6Q31_1570 [Bacteroidetes bacterium]|nr:hypothetical protein [Bacteroidota bacterium]